MYVNFRYLMRKNEWYFRRCFIVPVLSLFSKSVHWKYVLPWVKNVKLLKWKNFSGLSAIKGLQWFVKFWLEKLKVMFDIFFLFCFLKLKDNTFETRENHKKYSFPLGISSVKTLFFLQWNVFYFTSKALFVLKIFRL